MIFQWKQGISGDFTATTDWTPTFVPGPSDDVVIAARGTYVVTSSIDEAINSLSTGRGATLSITGGVAGLHNGSTFAITNGVANAGTIAVSNESTLLVGTTGVNTTFDNSGTIQLSGGGDGQITATGAFMVAGTVTLQGAGKVLLLDNGPQIVSNGSPAVLSNSIRIIGMGSIGDFSTDFTMINQSTGIVDATGVDSLLFEPNTLVDNSGILESTNPDTLPSVGGLIIDRTTIDNQSGGIIQAHGTGAHVDLNVATIVGGTLRTSGAGAVIETAPGAGLSVLDGTHAGNPINILGHVVVSDHTNLWLEGVINNNGSITIDSTEVDETGLNIQGNVTLQGGGDVVLTDNKNNFIASVNAGGTFTNVDNTISGAGTIDANNLIGGFINEQNGVFDADDSNPLVIVDASATNGGLIDASHGGTLHINNSLINNYIGTTGGTIAAKAGSNIVLSFAQIVGGNVAIGKGATFGSASESAISGALVTNAGTLGAEGGNLSIVGDVTNSGVLDANNSNLVIQGNVSGGRATIEGTGKIEFGGLSSAKVAFSVGSSGVLKLDHDFAGTVAGLATSNNGSVDFTDISFASVAASFKENALQTKGALSLTDGSNSASITLLGQYIASFAESPSSGYSGFVLSDDGSANHGTAVTYIAPPAMV